MKKLPLIGFFLCLFIIGLVVGANAQTARQDATGNYVSIKSKMDSTSAKATGKTYTDDSGNTYPVMISKNGKLFIVRTSKTGSRYNQYLKLEN